MADDRAGAFRALHRRGNPLVLANVWDAASARIVEEAGAPAIATSSAGMAWSLGCADGEVADLDEMLDAVRRVVRAVRVPVSADMEAGYARGIDELAGVMARLRETGAAGVNLEDWDVHARAPFPVDIARARVAAVKERCGDALFVNARTDLYLHDVGDEAERFEATVTRLRAFLAAGADGVFVPGVDDARTIGRLAAAVDAPLNVLAGPESPSVAEMAALGVARISTGSGPARRVLGEMRAIARELAEHGTFEFAGHPHAMRYAEINALF